MEETFDIEVISDYYQDTSKEVTVKVKEPVENTVYSSTQVSPQVDVGLGTVTSYHVTDTSINLTVDGPSGTTGYVIVTLPLDTQYVDVNSDHPISYYVLNGENAKYVVIRVTYASPVTVTIEYKTSRWIISTWNYVWYMLYLSYDRKFDKFYEKAVEAGVDNATLQKAMEYKQLAEQYYSAAEQYMMPSMGQEERLGVAVMALPYLRNAYLNILKAYKLLEEAINAAETQG